MCAQSSKRITSDDAGLARLSGEWCVGWPVNRDIGDRVALVIHRRKPRFLAYADLVLPESAKERLGVTFRDFQWIDRPPKNVDDLLKQILPDAVLALEVLLPPSAALH